MRGNTYSTVGALMSLQPPPTFPSYNALSPILAAEGPRYLTPSDSSHTPIPPSPTLASAETLLSFDLLIFNNNSGELFDAKQKVAFEAYLAAKKPILGIHAATASFLSGEDHTGAYVGLR